MSLVSICPRPFDWRRFDVLVPEGSTLQEIVEVAQPDVELRRYTEVIIGDRRIPQSWWRHVRPKPDAVVSINTLPQDGNILRGGLSLGIIAASLAIPAPFGPAIGIAGGLGLSFLMPPEEKTRTRDTGSFDSQTYSIGSSRNTLKQWGVIPQLFGKFRFAPPKAGEYAETVGAEQFLRVLLVLSTGLVSDPEITIGETSISEYDEVETEFRRGWHSDILTDRGAWSPASGSFPPGALFGDRWNASTNGIVDGVIFVPGDTIIRNHYGDGSKADHWDVNHDKPHKLFPTDPSTERFNAEVNHNDPVIRTTTTDADEIAVTLNFPALVQFGSKGDKQTAYVTFRIEYAPADSDVWINVGNFTVRGKSQTAVYWGHRWIVNRALDPDGQFDVRLTRLTPTNPTQNNEYISQGYWVALQSFTNESPIGDNEGFSTLAVRVKATGQLFGTLDTVMVKATSLEREWDSMAQEWRWGEARLPASHFRHILQQPVRDDGPLSDDRLDLSRLEEWSEADEAGGRYFDAYVDFETSEEEILKDIARSGFASKTTRGTTHSVSIDEPKGGSVRLFSPRNTFGYTGQLIYPNLPHAYRVAFINAEKNYTPDEITVYADGYGPKNEGDIKKAKIIEDKEYLGLTDRPSNWLQARRDMAEVFLRREVHKVGTDMVSIACEQGDKVELQHYAIAVGISAGRIKSVA